jgi:hypothetical protein
MTGSQQISRQRFAGSRMLPVRRKTLAMDKALKKSPKGPAFRNLARPDDI